MIALDSVGMRAGRARGVIIVIALIVVGIAIRASREENTSYQPPAGSTPSDGKYVPASDEGLGASIAIVVDVSGSMKQRAGGDATPKYVVARRALEALLTTTDSFVAKQPGFPIKVGLYAFSTHVQKLLPVTTYDRAELRDAFARLPMPEGGTAIGDAMDVAREDLYRAGTIRKYILVVTDGENTDGRSPDDVAHEIARRSEGAVRLYFVAFDVDAARFAFLRDVRGEVLGARNEAALRASLDTIYRGKILAEATDAGETLSAPGRGRAVPPPD